ncbi:MAG: hypothetical protein GVY04_19270 [Cyanobacteria bacterium]|jgi:hypothetical protein|nr:hypothetical protein [Cyanobacteria bacterium GSL.Bin1]
MIKLNWCLLSAGFSLLFPLPVFSQTQPLTAIRGTELDEPITITLPANKRDRLEKIQTSPPLQLNPSSYAIQFISLPLAETNSTLNASEVDAVPFQPTAIILADSGEEVAPGQWTSGRPDGHAPIGVMGDHVHGQGEWMLSYRYMFILM